MGFWDKMSGFFEKYGGRNGTDASSNYHSDSYGNVKQGMGNLGAGYGTYQYIVDREANRKNPAKNPENNAGQRGKSNSYLEGNTHVQMNKFVGDNGSVRRSQNRESGRTGKPINNNYYKNKGPNESYYATEKYNNSKEEFNMSYPANYDNADKETNGRMGYDRNNDKKTYTTPMYGNKVYPAQYDVDDSVPSTK